MNTVPSGSPATQPMVLGDSTWQEKTLSHPGTPPASICEVNQGSSFPAGDRNLWVS